MVESHLADFEAAARASRAAEFDWRAGYAAVARAIPADDAPASRLFGALLADIEADARSGPPNGYHNPLHTLDTMRAMDALCASSERLGLTLACPAHILSIVMLGHDLRHPGGASGPGRDLERMSADAVAEFARQCEMPAGLTQQIVDLILATPLPFQKALRCNSTGDLLAFLVGEADVMASLLPGLGVELATALTQEMQATGQPVAMPFESAPARRLFLGAYTRLSRPAQALGLGEVIAAQLAALPSAQNMF